MWPSQNIWTFKYVVFLYLCTFISMRYVFKIKDNEYEWVAKSRKIRFYNPIRSHRSWWHLSMWASFSWLFFMKGQKTFKMHPCFLIVAMFWDNSFSLPRLSKKVNNFVFKLCKYVEKYQICKYFLKVLNTVLCMTWTKSTVWTQFNLKLELLIWPFLKESWKKMRKLLQNRFLPIAPCCTWHRCIFLMSLYPLSHCMNVCCPSSTSITYNSIC